MADPYLKEGSVCTTSDLEHPFIVIEGLDGTGMYNNVYLVRPFH